MRALLPYAYLIVIAGLCLAVAASSSALTFDDGAPCPVSLLETDAF